MSAAYEDQLVRLSWSPVEGAAGYRIGDADGTRDLPASICADDCALSIGAEMVGADGVLQVSTVTAAGAVSDPESVPIDDTQLDAGDGDVPDETLEVLLVHARDPADPDAPPVVETVPAESMKEAEQIIENADAPGSGILWASLNSRIEESRHSARPFADGTQEEDRLWYLEGLEATWQRSAMRYDLLPESRGEGIVIGLVEPGGVDASHPSLQGAVLEGVNMRNPSGSGVSPPSTHATATASMIVGQPAGEVPGVAPGATILPVALGQGATDADMVNGIIWAVDAGADIINVSASVIGCTTAEPSSCPSLSAIKAATDYAEAHDVIVVAAAGNNGPGNCALPTNAARVPAVIDTVISVGAYGPEGIPWECTPGRPDVDLLVPGERLLHADLGGGYGLASGTSIAAPLMTGLIATLMVDHPWLTPAKLREMLPQWGGIQQRLDVVSALVSTGIIDPAEAALELPDGVSGIYPYEIGLGFAPGHDITELIWDIVEMPRLQAGGVIPASTPFTHHSHSNTNPWLVGRAGGHFPYGVITGVIYLFEDGTATATATWAKDRWTSQYSWGQSYGEAGALPGHGIVCTPTDPETYPAMRVQRWDLPAAVDVTPVAGSIARGMPEVELTFALGRGATAQHSGALPAPTIVADTWQDCPGQIEAARNPLGNLPADSVPWEQLEAETQDYFAALEEINALLVGMGPMTLEDPVVLGRSQSSTVTGDDRVIATFDFSVAPSDQGSARS
ncbi:S8 family serine peptidase [Streptomyces xiamenensis]|uniref:S8 family peptidase n=1 Tax=Streptomyces xiamenensis TaxID=408015 RepID=UPI0036EAB00B